MIYGIRDIKIRRLRHNPNKTHHPALHRIETLIVRIVADIVLRVTAYAKSVYGTLTVETTRASPGQTSTTRKDTFTTGPMKT